jgi:hypothetical protein
MTYEMKLLHVYPHYLSQNLGESFTGGAVKATKGLERSRKEQETLKVGFIDPEEIQMI